jgi:hypothetical protein
MLKSPTIDGDKRSDSLPSLPPPREFWLARWIASTRLRWLLLVVLYVAVQPPEAGLGVDLCMLHRLTGAPCPGCGMTRSGANMLRGNFRLAWQFHPFGYLFMPVLFAFAGLSLMPAAIRGAVARQCTRYERVLRILNAVVLVGILIFGVVRFGLVLAGRMAFPGGGP